jgi:hypothetical protein
LAVTQDRKSLALDRAASTSLDRKSAGGRGKSRDCRVAVADRTPPCVAEARARRPTEFLAPIQWNPGDIYAAFMTNRVVSSRIHIRPAHFGRGALDSVLAVLAGVFAAGEASRQTK